MNKPRGQKPSPPGDDPNDDGEPWRHAPIAPRDAGIAESFGKAVSDVVTGPLEGDADKAVKPLPKPVRKAQPGR